VVDVWLFVTPKKSESHNQSATSSSLSNVPVIKQEPLDESFALPSKVTSKSSAGRSLLKSMKFGEPRKQESLLKIRSVEVNDTHGHNVTIIHSESEPIERTCVVTTSNMPLKSHVATTSNIQLNTPVATACNISLKTSVATTSNIPLKTHITTAANASSSAPSTNQCDKDGRINLDTAKVHHMLKSPNSPTSVIRHNLMKMMEMKQQTSATNLPQHKMISILTTQKNVNTTSAVISVKNEDAQNQNSSLITMKNSDVLKLQHHDYAKPQQVLTGVVVSPSTSMTNKCITISTNNLQNSSKVTTINPSSLEALCKGTNLTEIAGRKVIQLKSLTKLTPIDTSNKAVNKNPMRIFHTSLLKSSALNTENNVNGIRSTSMVNGTKLMLTNSPENSKHVICLSVGRNGVVQRIPNMMAQQPVPPLIMISKPPADKTKKLVISPKKLTQTDIIKREAEQNALLTKLYTSQLK
jgi:lipoprotein-anchoring transpeptidase ErfK/SrfK